jgi:hypothetical protein
VFEHRHAAHAVEGVFDVDIDQDAVGVEREKGGCGVDDCDAAVRGADVDLFFRLETHDH